MALMKLKLNPTGKLIVGVDIERLIIDNKYLQTSKKARK